MEDIELLKEGPVLEKNHEIQKLKRPGRDKESRMMDISEEESSVEDVIPLPGEEDMSTKSCSSNKGATKEGKESKTMDSMKSKEKDISTDKSNKHKKQKDSKDKRQRDTTESSSESSDDSSSFRKSRNKKRSKKEKGKRTEKHGSSRYNKADYKSKGKRTDSSYSSSSSESSDSSPQTSESNHEASLKAKKIKEAIFKRIFAKKKGLMVSIQRKYYESPNEVDELQFANYHDKIDSVQAILSTERKINESSNKDKNLQERNSSDDSQDRSPISKKDHSNKNKTLNDQPEVVEEESKVENYALLQTKVGFNDNEENRNIPKQDSSDKSPTRFVDSFIESNNEIIGDANEALKGDFNLQIKELSSFIQEDNETLKISAKNSSSDSSSDSDRSRSKKRGRKTNKTKKKDESLGKMKFSVEKRKGRKKRHGEKKSKKRTSSASSTSSSSSKSMSDSSSSSSASSSSSSSKTSSKSSVSKGRSSSSSSSTSSSSFRKHKHSFKNKDSAKRRSRSPLRKKDAPPRPKKIHVGHLTKNINKQHIYEIFSLYGVVKNVDLPMDRSNGLTPRGFAYVEYDKADDAEKALLHMNGGIIDGQKINVAPVLPFKPRPMPMRRVSPNRRPFGGNWRYTPPFRSRGGGLMNMGARDRRRRIRSPPRRRSPRRRTRSRSPIRRRHLHRASRSSSH